VLLKLGELRELAGTSRHAIEAEIDHIRDITLDMLRGLE
jgi:biotin operon repressor